MFGSVRAVTASAVSALRYTIQQRAAPFSVRQWIGTAADFSGLDFDSTLGPSWRAAISL